MIQTFAIIGAIAAAVILIRVWTGALNTKAVENESLASVEKFHPYFPKLGAITVSVIVAGILFALSLKYGTNTSLASLTGSAAAYRTLAVFLLIVGFGVFDQLGWHGKKDYHKYFYAFVLGTLVTWILIAFKRSFFETGIGHDPFLMALGFICVVIGWKFLFGPWDSSIKATVLGTFLFWVIYAILRYKTSEELLATGIAAVIALIPVVIWGRLFLAYHKEKPAVVALAFFAGMLSTVPILFYAELMQRKIELNFFIFKVVPLSYGSTSRDFVSNSVFSGSAPVTSIVLTTLVTYLIVGVIEEISKYWVLRHSSREFFTSIDDTLQLSILVALGFAFAENLVNPAYFIGFVRDYLLRPPSPLWGSLMGAVFGRAILTTMVHVLSTGVLGYFFGVAFFASPLMREQFHQGKGHPILTALHRMLGIRTEALFARTQILTGFALAILLHGLFDFIVTLPEVLPGNPTSVGALLGYPPSSFLSGIGITLLPSLFYVVGGFWILALLFERKDDMKEFGNVVESQTFVS